MMTSIGEASESDEDSDLFDSEEEEAISKGLKAGKTLGRCMIRVRGTVVLLMGWAVCLW